MVEGRTQKEESWGIPVTVSAPVVGHMGSCRNSPTAGRCDVAHPSRSALSHRGSGAGGGGGLSSRRPLLG